MSEEGYRKDAGGPTPGERLAQARAAANLSVVDAARQLKLTPAQVMAMEAGQHDQLPGPVFVRGFIRNYARLLGLDPEPLLAEIAERAPQPPQHETRTPSAEIPLPTAGAMRWHRYAIALAALLIPAAIYQLSSDDTPQVTVRPPQAAPADELRVAAPAPESAASPASVQEEKTPETASAASSPPVAGTKPSPEHKPGTQRVVKLKFAEEAWAEVRDGSGRKILYQLNPAGSERAVTGTPPLVLVVGKAKSVRVTVDDQPVDLAPHTTTDVARLTLE